MLIIIYHESNTVHVFSQVLFLIESLAKFKSERDVVVKEY